MELLPFDIVLSDNTSDYFKVRKEDYLPEGLYKIIDQGQDFIGGYTNNEELINRSNLPTIVFGDHTRIFKYIDFPFTIGADGVKILKVNSEIAHAKYVYYFLKSCKIPQAGYSRHFKFLREIKIPIPHIDHQACIANILSKAETLIKQRKESLHLLDEFLKSTFLEMFGDPVKNEKGWKIVSIGDHVDVLTGFAFKSKEYSTDRDGIPLCGGLIIQPHTIEWEKANYWSAGNVRGLDRYFLEENDVVIAMDRPWISTGFKIRIIEKQDLPALLVQRTARLRSSVFDQHYLYYMFRHKSFETHCKPTETTVPHISPNDIKKFDIPMPPKEVQLKFSEISRKIGSIRKQYQSSLEALENLYASLSQKAFKGELQFKSETKVIPLRTDEKEEDYFKKRKALACYIINQSLDDDKFGDTKFEKLLNLSDQYAIQRNLGQTYYQKVAGPYDNEFTKLFYIQIAAEKLYKRKRRGNQSVFIPDINHKKTFTADTYFSNDELSRVDKLITYFKKYTYEEPEIISTLYTVWNNRIIRQQQITDGVLKQDFLDWDVKKKKHKDRLDAALAWMRKENIIPNGWGKLIEKPKGKQRKLVVGKKRANSKRAS